MLYSEGGGGGRVSELFITSVTNVIIREHQKVFQD